MTFLNIFRLRKRLCVAPVHNTALVHLVPIVKHVEREDVIYVMTRCVKFRHLSSQVINQLNGTALNQVVCIIRLGASDFLEPVRQACSHPGFDGECELVYSTCLLVVKCLF